MKSKLLTPSASIAALLLFVSILSGCSSSGGSVDLDTSATTPTTTTPTTTTPAGPDYKGPTNLLQSLADNGTMDASKLTAVSVVYDEPLSSASTVTLKTSTGADVTPAPKITVLGPTLSFTPTTYLTAGTSYVATFKTLDYSNNKAWDVVIRFSATAGSTTTTDTVAPKFVSQIPTTTTGLSSTLVSMTATYDEDLSSASSVVVTPSFGSAVTVSKTVSGKNISFTAANLTAGASYTATFSAQDAAGNKSTDKLITFTTAAASSGGSSSGGSSSSSWWPPAATSISAVGTQITNPGTLPLNCASWTDACWQNSVKDGTVKFASTSASSPALIYAYFKSAGGAWYLVAINYTDNSATSGLAGSPVGADLWLWSSSSSEIDWVTGSAKGAIAHRKSDNTCSEVFYDETTKAIASNAVTCP